MNCATSSSIALSVRLIWHPRRIYSTNFGRSTICRPYATCECFPDRHAICRDRLRVLPLFHSIHHAMTTSTPQETDDQFMVSLQSQDFSELRDAVRRICRDYPGEYWRKLDNESGYPTEFVRA